MPATLRALMASAIDYAGLFPPASLSLVTVARNFAAYRISSHAWALGRLVVPAARLQELAGIVREYDDRRNPLPVAALVGADHETDAELIRAQNSASDQALLVESAELRVDRVESIEPAVRVMTRTLPLYLEVPVSADPRPYIEEIARLGARAKIRTGGITADAFPSTANVARFLAQCAELDVCFKATAGLHHPVRGEHRLTYDTNAVRAPMFGFLNVLVAAAFARNGASVGSLEELLEEREPTQIVFVDESVEWRGRSIPFAQVADARRDFIGGFGSCSFREPIDDLHLMSFL